MAGLGRSRIMRATTDTIRLVASARDIYLCTSSNKLSIEIIEYYTD